MSVYRLYPDAPPPTSAKEPPPKWLTGCGCVGLSLVFLSNAAVWVLGIAWLWERVFR